MPRRFALLVLALLPGTPGCFVAYPSLASSPGAPVPASAEVVAVVARAKRIQHGTAPEPEESHTLRRVDVDGGEVGPQFQPHLFHGLLVLGSAHYTYLMTKLYRPGYKTVILDQNAGPARVEWEPAMTPDAQEEAVRKLVYHARRGFARVPKPMLPPGSSDPRHREVLRFAAGEFERVARLHPAGSAGADRCRAEAEVLRARAAE